MLYFNEKWHLDMSFFILYGMKRREGRSLKKEKKTIKIFSSFYAFFFFKKKKNKVVNSC
jgi:hypothetical protein